MSAGSVLIRSARSVTPSEIRSENECPASAIIAADRPVTPAKSLRNARTKFTAAPTQVMRLPSSSSSSRSALRCVAVCRTIADHDSSSASRSGATTRFCT